MGDTRYTRPGRHSYNTDSHKYKAVRTPGGRLTGGKIVKTVKGPRCSDCKVSLPGIPHCRGSAVPHLKKRQRTVSRAYGGSTCATCVKTRILRAFLLEEQKAVKKVLAERQGKKKSK
jgi:large subunit ribosomal protein L34e